MHWSGKVFAWLLIPLVLVAMLLSAKLVKVRNSWTAKIEKSKADYLKVAPEVLKAQLELDRVLGEYHRATTHWGPYAVAPTAVQNAAAGGLTVGLGSNHGVKPGQWLYGFEIKPDGSSIYRGDFVAATVREGESLMQPNWRVRAGDTEGWQAGNWRWRLVLPSAYPNRFDEMEQSLLKQDELLADRQQTLAIQHQLIESATAQLKLREAELVGGPELSKNEALDREFRDGLVATIEEIEELRNGELVAIDGLRRKVRSLNQQIQQIQSENRELVEKLPQPATEVTRKP